MKTTSIHTVEVVVPIPFGVTGEIDPEGAGSRRLTIRANSAISLDDATSKIRRLAERINDETEPAGS